MEKNIFFMNIYKNIFRMVAMTSMVRKRYFSQDYKLYIRSMILSIEIKTLISVQNLEDIFGVIHQRIKGKLL